jgi:hypothetical protein
VCVCASCTQWMVALWTRSLAVEPATLAWNLLLLEGDAVMLTVALGVVLAIAPALLACDDLAKCRDLCRDAPRTLSLAAFRRCTSACELDAGLMRPLAPWIKPVDVAPAVPPAIEL